MTRHPTVGELVERLAEPLQLDDLGGGIGLERALPGPDISSPGLALAGYVGRFVSDRLQVLGETEITYLQSLDSDRRREIIDIFYSFPLPAVFITKGQQPPAGLLERAKASGTALIRTALSTAEFYRGVKPALEELFAPTTTLHGSLADVYGVGLFFTGASGIGKSECVLDLVERGHRLVADDLVLVARRGQDLLIGRAHELAAHHMEIRGVGLINIPSIFGIRSVRQQKRIEVVVHLETWDKNAPVERTGLDTSSASILGVEIPKITVPLNPGKNITVIAEVIAMNHLLQYSGIKPAEQFNDRLIQRMQKASAIRRYLQEDVE
ncbi:MAG: HPr(Ser) kinase/phosphatase [Gemmatimonadota bacterium]|nr:HPr(Ser) kinase/phosphatase [Gemmatimonadota bacterium]